MISVKWSKEAKEGSVLGVVSGEEQQKRRSRDMPIC